MSKINYFFKQWPETAEKGFFDAKLDNLKKLGYVRLTVEYGSGDSGYSWMNVQCEEFDCPQCSISRKQADAVAIHLIDKHGWHTEKARVWLRDEVEPKDFYKAA